MMPMKSSFKIKAGQIVLIHVPFTDLSSRKVRPALVVTDQTDDDLLIAPISSTVNSDRDDYVIKTNDYKTSQLPIVSCVRYTKLFTLNQKMVLKAVSELQTKTILRLKRKIADYILDKK